MSMETKGIRKENMLALLAKHGTLEKLAEAAKVDASYLSQVKNNTRNMGARFARKMEEGLSLSVGWMDTPHSDDRGIYADSELEANLLLMFRGIQSLESKDAILGFAQRKFTEDNPGKSAGNPFDKVGLPVAKKKKTKQ